MPRLNITVWAERAALTATLLLPLFLLHARALAEIMIAIINLAFLLRTRDGAWLNTLWMRIGLLWWGWLVFCSIPGIGAGGWESFIQALATLRFLLFVAALAHFVLVAPQHRRWLQAAIIASAIYIAAQSLLQFAVGRNLFGDRRSIDGELTGPFDKPRAGAPLSRILFPALLPSVVAWPRLPAALLTLAALAVVVLIGQRMPLLLTGLGFITTGLFLPRLRPILLVAVLAGGALIGASSVVSPPTFYRLVTKFSSQMEHFAASPYGQISARAVAMAEAHPLTGRGFDGFRTGCALPRYFHGWRPGDDGGGAAICVQHPHNHYLQALTDAGIPGLLLFSALVLVWLFDLQVGLWRQPDPLRVGLFVAALIQEWPLASASALTSMPLSGWFFLLLGYGLAEARLSSRLAHPHLVSTLRQEA